MIELQLTEKVFAKGGLNWTEKFNFDRTKQIAFSDYQITKKSNMKSKLRLNASGFSIKYSTPPFANTMLAVVFIYFYDFYYFGFIIKSKRNSY